MENVILEKQFLRIVEDELADRHWTRTDLAREIGISRQMVTDYLNGRRSPGADVMERFFSALDLEPEIRVKRKKATSIA